MSTIRMFRVNAYDNVAGPDGVEIYFKVDDDEGNLLGTFCVAGDGLYYYRAGSSVMTPGESESTRNTWNGYFPMADLGHLLEAVSQLALQKSEGPRIRVKGGSVVISGATD